jgi:hypothetical protein
MNRLMPQTKRKRSSFGSGVGFFFMLFFSSIRRSIFHIT